MHEAAMHFFSSQTHEGAAVPHRCQHIDADGLQCTFYLNDGDLSYRCPLHSPRFRLLANLTLFTHSLPWSKRRTIVCTTQLYLDPQARFWRGTLHSGSAIRLLAAPRYGWVQIEVVYAERLPAHARGWVEQSAVR